jgi:hypothetical protein
MRDTFACRNTGDSYSLRPLLSAMMHILVGPLPEPLYVGVPHSYGLRNHVP